MFSIVPSVLWRESAVTSTEPGVEMGARFISPTSEHAEMTGSMQSPAKARQTLANAHLLAMKRLKPTLPALLSSYSRAIYDRIDVTGDVECLDLRRRAQRLDELCPAAVALVLPVEFFGAVLDFLKRLQ